MQSTTRRRPMELAPGRVVVSWPDDRRPSGDSTGPWTITERPSEYGQVVRVDAVDASGRTVTWVLPSTYGVAVEPSEAEQQAAAAHVIARLAAADLPAVCEWRINERGAVGQLAAVYDQEQEQALQEWADHLGSTVTATARATYTHLAVLAEVDGVPVEIWTHGCAPERAQVEP